MTSWLSESLVMAVSPAWMRIGRSGRFYEAEPRPTGQHGACWGLADLLECLVASAFVPAYMRGPPNDASD
jgi:hypothetical protein